MRCARLYAAAEQAKQVRYAPFDSSVSVQDIYAPFLHQHFNNIYPS